MSTDDTGNESNGQQCPPCIGPYSGYLQPGEKKNDEQSPEGIDPVTTVELRVTGDVVIPEDAERPPAPTPSEGSEPGSPNEAESETGIPDGPPQGTPEFYFDPVGIHIQPGETVEFLIREQLHTVTAFHPRLGFQQRIPDEATGFTSPPFVAEDSWFYRFDEPGVYDILCLPHLGLGMVMRAVVVNEETEEIPQAYPDPGPDTGGESIPPTALEVLNGSALSPQNIVERGSVAWSDLSDVDSSPPEGAG